ncbi:hypothetical protein MBM_07516 [Drepanopeziza brunnea f. sp. 'multigermtubi' MB_m1]|uniref:Uncharacterized protein n=1 Tax=Marssonina brunnea f. sp. multigermtubi (strain MB_m1) TaxID=1072389 RepID=K1WN30_MARBU|nr:uncharacterized protein MBM_07516 [Drepanopeziza brunnea f. sp. 'multigermtubi' MB_m1]EKD14286.1 hypothetical protein MBM_07516 [Drepanopeziza brunnea f. sp. 'multigermtubi' MB_m1]
MVCNSTNCAVQGSASPKVMVCQNTTLPTLNPEVKVVPFDAELVLATVKNLGSSLARLAQFADHLAKLWKCGVSQASFRWLMERRAPVRHETEEIAIGDTIEGAWGFVFDGASRAWGVMED